MKRSESRRGAVAPRSVTILGSTGSVGCSTVDLIARNPPAYAVEALTANNNVGALVEQVHLLKPRLAVVADETKYHALKEGVAGLGVEVAAGEAAVVEAASRPADWVMGAIVGAAGLAPTLAAVRRGVIVGLANKECLVCAGDLFMGEVARSGATLLPVDSEHSAIFQVFDDKRRETVEKIVLTASGGPFRTWTREAMARATPAQAVAHPNWDMGAKISVDSATMMNKGLEIIEAHHLFAVDNDRIDVLIHPQSIIHSMVAYIDGSVLAHLGAPDMRTPIAYALAYPDRMAAPVKRLDLAELGQLTFERPDEARFPALRLARHALATGDGAATILNAANEIAVADFLGGRIGFLDIVRVVEATLDSIPTAPVTDLAGMRALDSQARRIAAERSRAAAMAG